MSQTNTAAGQMEVAISMQDTVTGDQAGQIKSAIDYILRFASAASLPSIAQADGFLYGTVVCAAGNWLLADVDPFQAMGASVCPGAYSPVGKKVKAIIVQNLDAANTITLLQGATNGLAIGDAAGHGIIIPPSGILVLTIPAGSAALVAGTNDKLTIAVSAGSPQANVLIVFGT